MRTPEGGASGHWSSNHELPTLLGGNGVKISLSKFQGIYDTLTSIYRELRTEREWVIARARTLTPESVGGSLPAAHDAATQVKESLSQDASDTYLQNLIARENYVAKLLNGMRECFSAYVRTDEITAESMIRLMPLIEDVQVPYTAGRTGARRAV